MYRILLAITCLSIFVASFAVADPVPTDGMQLHALPAAKGELYTDKDGKYRYSFPKLTDMQVQLTPLGELSKWVNELNRGAATALHFAGRQKQEENAQQQQQINGFACSGPVMVMGRPDVLPDAQWDILADRIHNALIDPDFSTVKSASVMLFQISQCLHGDQLDQVVEKIYSDGHLLKLINQLDNDEIQTRISRLSMAGASMFIIPPTSTDECFEFFDRLEKTLYVRKRSVGRVTTANELREVQSFISILSIWRFKNPHMGEVDEEFARRIIQLADVLPHDDEQGRAIRFLLAQTYGAPKTVMEYVTDLYNHDDPIAKSEALRILGRQVSIYDNKDPASRAIAIPYAIPIYRDRAKTPFTDEQSQCILMDVAGSGRPLGPDAVQLLDVYIDLLEINDQHIRPMAISSLIALGDAAHSAIPRLKELAAQGGMHEEYIREAIYYIGQEGEKPRDYDRNIEIRRSVMQEAGCLNIESTQSNP